MHYDKLPLHFLDTDPHRVLDIVHGRRSVHQYLNDSDDKSYSDGDVVEDPTWYKDSDVDPRYMSRILLLFF